MQCSIDLMDSHSECMFVNNLKQTLCHAMALSLYDIRDYMYTSSSGHIDNTMMHDCVYAATFTEPLFLYYHWVYSQGGVGVCR